MTTLYASHLLITVKYIINPYTSIQEKLQWCFHTRHIYRQ